jgi:sterol desaturase/sphingolipid hydroxylase (fatty acid hydroxylase superfamily)
MPISPIIGEAWRSLGDAIQLLAFSAILFTFIVFVVKGDEAIAAGRRAMSEIRLNLWWYFLDAIFVAPVIGLVVTAIHAVVNGYSLEMVNGRTWEAAGRPVTFLAVVFLGDFISYWRHRLEHTRWLWPTHAIHHSDTEMTFLTLARFHPLNRLVTTCVDIGFLALLGFPTWALIANVIVRHYYGELIHVDLPWMYGPLRHVFVSPVMHKWHHALDYTGSGSNFATVFSVFDRTFRTHHVPGLCTGPLGVNDDLGSSIAGQFMYPFVCWFNDLRPRHDRALTKTQRDDEALTGRSSETSSC